jgi:hypothetical protein
MSIEFSPAFDSGRSSLPVRGMGASPMQPAAAAARRRQAKKRLKPPTHGRGDHATSERRLAANRRNASAPPARAPPRGKPRASRNAIKHGLCSPYACPGRRVPRRLRDLRPRDRRRTATAHRDAAILIPHIANLMWRPQPPAQSASRHVRVGTEKVRQR